MRTELHRDQPDDRSTTFTVTVDRDDLSLTETPLGVVVRLTDFATGGAPGHPALPVTRVRIAAPDGQWPIGLTVEREKWTRATRGLTFVAPAQHARPAARITHVHCDADCSCRREDRAPIDSGFPAPPIVPPDVDAYLAAAEEPPPVVRSAGIETVGGIRIAVIEISPVRMTRKAVLELCTAVTVTVQFGPEPAIDDREAAAAEFRERFGDAFDEQRLQLLPEALPVTETESVRLRDVVRGSVLNPEVVGKIELDWPRFEFPSAYVIVTDDYTWNPMTLTRGAPRPGVVAQFERLAQAKRARGITARVVTITEILDGRWGDFRTGSRDLAEVIRRFLVAKRQDWGISWLLVGGDVSIVPARQAAGGMLGTVAVGTNAKPDNGQSFWTGAHLRIHAQALGDWWGNSVDNRLTRISDGTLIPYDAAGTSGSASPGWYFTTGDDYATRSATPTEWIRVEGPQSLVATPLQFLYAWNTIPTDFYYASLSSFLIGTRRIDIGFFSFTLPWVYVPEHAWDAAGNGLYGQNHADGTDIDGVVLRTDLSVGRAPVEDAAQAAVFVDKTLAYERAGGVWGLLADRDWPRRMVLVSSDWGGRTFLWPTAAATPGDNQFVTQAGQNRALLKLTAAPADYTWDLIARITETDRRELPFKTDPSASVRGWYYAMSATDARPSAIRIPLFFTTLTFPVPSPWIVVHGAAAERAPQAYEFNPQGAEGSMADQERLRKQIRSEVPGIDRFSRHYEDERDLSWFDRWSAPVQYLTESGLRGGLDAAPHLVSLSGHGSQSGVAHLSTGMAAALRNGTPGFIGYADSCLTNGFDASDAMGEALLLNGAGGAVGYVGNTRFSWIGVGDDFQRAFFHRLASTRHLGLLNDSRVGVFGSTGYWSGYDRWQIFSLNLLGDPELRVYRAAFPRLVLEADLGHGLLRVTIERAEPVPGRPGDPGPVEGALVHVRAVDGHGEEVVLETDADGIAKLPRKLRGRAVEVTASHGDAAVSVLELAGRDG
ncbi:MAG: C25 family cysteine peptidase [Candidatus Microbacterium phytovorans]|uniref:C25 family cysteine peptidase n=1 Tax=Candidatus Microbacterium phytovorans TaxID=3121374 RepID=A0AAJ5W2Q6_9MICO|nr:C25 family cysteine peptidase [Microbacterium sp.]WEK13290.1 MAG: C25 family cysteine peptidase [Microbacterium sp.]